jgi:glycosyltransferase involved in cell wall biosynthesis
VRIGLIIDTFNIGGAETMVFEIAKLLKQNDHSPVLLHFGSSYVESFCTDQHIESHLIPHRRFYKKTVLLPLFAFKTKSFVKSLNLDCLHAHLFGPIVAFAPLAWMAKLPFVGTLHDVYMVEGSAHRAFLLKQALFFNAKLTTVSNPMREFYLKTLRCNEQDIVYIPNCTRINAHRDARLAVRYSLGLSEHTVALISVGRLVGLKRFNILIDAVAKLDERSSFKAFIVGDGPERSSLEALIVKYQLQDHVVMLGERSDVEMLLAASDIFSLTSETEGMSKSILEALAAGLPVVATDVGGNKDLVKHGDNGFLSQEHSSSEVRKFFSILINNAELRTRMGENSLALLKQEYNSDLFLKRHIEIYNNSIEKR